MAAVAGGIGAGLVLVCIACWCRCRRARDTREEGSTAPRDGSAPAHATTVAWGLPGSHLTVRGDRAPDAPVAFYAHYEVAESAAGTARVGLYEVPVQSKVAESAAGTARVGLYEVPVQSEGWSSKYSLPEVDPADRLGPDEWDKKYSHTSDDTTV